MRKVFLFLFIVLTTICVEAQVYKFDFTPGKRCKEGYVKITPNDFLNENSKYGFDFHSSAQTNGTQPFYFSVRVPDGNYHVSVVLGSKKTSGITTVRGESRRLFYENIVTRRGEFKTCSFVVNKRDTIIKGKQVVRIKPRERNKLNWDDKLTLEFNGEKPVVAEIVIEKVDNVPTIFLCGNSTVVDQDYDPWASWGQMITRFFTDKVCIANYAESGESANTFISAGRLAKLLTKIKPGDYVLMEFGHNDQKQKGPGIGAYYSFATSLKKYIDEARAHGAYSVLVTPTRRRSFNEKGEIINTHKDYPDAMRWVAEKENVPLIELNNMTKVMFESLGVEGTKKAFVHYPMGSFPNQTKPFADNTHFTPYGAYQISKCIIEGMKSLNLPIVEYLRDDYVEYNPAKPDDFKTFKWNNSPIVDLQKPDGN